MKKEKRPLPDKNNTKARKRFSLTLLYAAFTFIVMLLSLGIAVVCFKLFVHYDVLMHFPPELIPDVNQALVFMILVSLAVGALLALPVVQLQLFPLNKFITGLNSLSSGDFHTRLHFRRPVSLMPSYAEMEKSFNKLAEELGNTEVLRSDFVNNFSHEFKTPIVSIAGFARLLQKEQLSEEQRKEYLNAIYEESMRLSNMATNVLNLSHMEKQTILSHIQRYNVSEQIRACVLLLERNWAEKEIEWNLDLDEREIEGDEELLKQVWINLLDNAIKFSPPQSVLDISIKAIDDFLVFSFANPGTIPAEALHKLWQKFYQGDSSHTNAGNGIGLPIVKAIAELHGGGAMAESREEKVIISVIIPQYH